jgi:hypothetical protein
MARALAAGEGFAHPFDRPTGPTAWQPPLLPAILAGLLWVSDGDRYFVMTVVVCLQVCVLIGTGVLVLALVRPTTTRIAPAVAAVVFLGGLLCHFWLCFQYTHDGWLVLLAFDLLIAGLCWCRPLRGWKAAAGWGLLGGTCAQINPGVGLAWGLLSLPAAWRGRAWSRLALAVLVAGLTLAPWTLRNWLVFGRLVPMKSNFFYELYQSHCLQKEGQLQGGTFRFHPYGSRNPERQEYNRLGEAAFMDRKCQQFWEAARADPLDYPDRVAHRFLNATLWYEPFGRDEPTRRPWVFWASRLTHPLPFVALMVLVFTAARRPLHGAQVAVIGVYFLYLLPYAAASYYERYALPLVGVKVLLLLWALDRILSWWPRCRRSLPLGKPRTMKREAPGKNLLTKSLAVLAVLAVVGPAAFAQPPREPNTRREYPQEFAHSLKGDLSSLHWKQWPGRPGDPMNVKYEESGLSGAQRFPGLLLRRGRPRHELYPPGGAGIQRRGRGSHSHPGEYRWSASGAGRACHGPAHQDRVPGAGAGGDGTTGPAEGVVGGAGYLLRGGDHFEFADRPVRASKAPRRGETGGCSRHARRIGDRDDVPFLLLFGLRQEPQGQVDVGRQERQVSRVQPGGARAADRHARLPPHLRLTSRGDAGESSPIPGRSLRLRHFLLALRPRVGMMGACVDLYLARIRLQEVSPCRCLALARPCWPWPPCWRPRPRCPPPTRRRP